MWLGNESFSNYKTYKFMFQVTVRSLNPEAWQS